MPYLLAIIALIIGTLLGLQLPDADQVFTLLGLVHRSILTHGLLLPLVVLLLTLGMASCLPNPVLDSRATARRYMSRLRRMAQP